MSYGYLFGVICGFAIFALIFTAWMWNEFASIVIKEEEDQSGRNE